MEKTEQDPPAKADDPAEKHPKRNSKQKLGDEQEPFTEEDFLAALRKVAREGGQGKAVGKLVCSS